MSFVGIDKILNRARKLKVRACSSCFDDSIKTGQALGMPKFRRPSRRALSLLMVVIALAAGVGLAVDRLGPPQDVPWKPFDLDQPIGLATHYKIALIGRDEARCRAALAAGGISFDPVPPRRERQCSVVDAGQLGEGLAPLIPARPVMTCREALALATWERHSVQPAARRELGEGVVGIEHFGTYDCRPIRGQPGQLSQHAFANAIDVAGFRLADRREISVLKDYRRADGAGRFLHQVHADGCRVFGHSLGPDFNADHRDHLHLDMADFGWGLAGFCL